MADQMEALRGSCMCGACKFTATPKAPEAHVCHCGMCRKWSGGMFISTNCGSSVRFDDGAPVGSYKGSEWGERLFCTACGSTLLWQMQSGEMQNVSIQCFDDPGQFTLVSQIYIDRKPGCYALSGETKTMTEAEVVALFAPDSG